MPKPGNLAANWLVIRFVTAKLKAATQRLRNRIRRMGASRIARSEMTTAITLISPIALAVNYSWHSPISIATFDAFNGAYPPHLGTNGRFENGRSQAQYCESYLALVGTENRKISPLLLLPIIGVLFTYRYQTTNGTFTRRAKQITQNIGRHCNSEDQSGNVGRDGGHNSMVQHSPSKGRFYERNEYFASVC
jgi:hypothetical protein